MTSTAKTCPMCGATFNDPRSARGGRPRIYCGSECREVTKLLGRLEGQLERLGARLEDSARDCDTPEAGLAARQAASRVRSRLWAAGNQLANRCGPQARAYRTKRTRTRSGWRGLEKG